MSDRTIKFLTEIALLISSACFLLAAVAFQHDIAGVVFAILSVGSGVEFRLRKILEAR